MPIVEKSNVRLPIVEKIQPEAVFPASGSNVRVLLYHYF